MLKLSYLNFIEEKIMKSNLLKDKHKMIHSFFFTFIRYIVCKGLKPNKKSVQHYMHFINVDLNKYMSAVSTEDVTDVVPLEILLDDKPFFDYVLQSNESWVCTLSHFHQPMSFLLFTLLLNIANYGCNNTLSLTNVSSI